MLRCGKVIGDTKMEELKKNCNNTFIYLEKLLRREQIDIVSEKNNVQGVLGAEETSAIKSG